jgi:hypothetical protein
MAGKGAVEESSYRPDTQSIEVGFKKNKITEVQLL